MSTSFNIDAYESAFNILHYEFANFRDNGYLEIGGVLERLAYTNSWEADTSYVLGRTMLNFYDNGEFLTRSRVIPVRYADLLIQAKSIAKLELDTPAPVSQDSTTSVRMKDGLIMQLSVYVSPESWGEKLTIIVTEKLLPPAGFGETLSR